MLRYHLSSRLIFLSLPFYDEVSCSAGVLTMNYLDDLAKFENPTSEETRKEVRERGDRPESWVPHGDFKGSLDDAFHLWDAVSNSVEDLLYGLDTDVR